MDDSDILELVKDGIIEPDDVDAFHELEEYVQEMIVAGDIEMDEASNW